MTEFVNILFYAFAFGPFILYLCRGKGSMKVLPFFKLYPLTAPQSPKRGLFIPIMELLSGPSGVAKGAE